MEDGKKILSEDIIPSLKAKVEAKQDKLTAGNNITITNDNVISASGAAGANNGKLTIEKNGTEVGSFTADQATDTAINITVPTTATEVGALADTTKYAANIVMNMDTASYQITTTLKDQDGNSIGNPQTIDLPLESVVVSGAYNAATKEVELTLEDGSKVSFSVADLVAGLQTEITDANKLNADLVDDTTATHKFSTAAEKTKLSGLANIKSVGSGLNLNASTGELTANTPPTVNNATITIQRNGIDVDSFTVNQATNKSINISVPTTVASLSDAGQYAKKTDLPTVNNGTLTIQRNGTNVATFTANQSGTSTANISVPNITTTAIDPGEGSALAANNYIGVYGQTSDLVETNDIADGAVTSAKIGSEAVLNQHLAPNSVTSDNVDWGTLPATPKSVITIAKTGNGAVSASSVIPLETSKGVLGSGLSLSSGKVVIGDGITHVLVSGVATGDYVSGFKRLQIRKNGVSVAGVFMTTADSSGYITGAIPEMIVDVSKGDTLELYNQDSGTTFWSFGTYMTVIGFN